MTLRAWASLFMIGIAVLLLEGDVRAVDPIFATIDLTMLVIWTVVLCLSVRRQS